jgi:hypothetical protein
VTQRLKLEPSPISQTHVDKVFSPVCECATRAAHIDFSIRRADHLRIVVRTPDGPVTVADKDFAKGMVHVRWDGRDAAGSVVPDGTYFALVHMQRAQRTIDLPNPIQVDTVKPVITLVKMSTAGNKTTFTYRISERAHALLFANGRRVVRTYSTNRHGRFNWYRTVAGDVSPPRLELEAEDLAGNRSGRSRIQPA